MPHFNKCQVPQGESVPEQGQVTSDRSTSDIRRPSLFRSSKLPENQVYTSVTKVKRPLVTSQTNNGNEGTGVNLTQAPKKRKNSVVKSQLPKAPVPTQYDDGSEDEEVARYTSSLLERPTNEYFMGQTIPLRILSPLSAIMDSLSNTGSNSAAGEGFQEADDNEPSRVMSPRPPTAFFKVTEQNDNEGLEDTITPEDLDNWINGNFNAFN